MVTTLSTHGQQRLDAQRRVPPTQHNSCNLAKPDIVAMSICIGIHAKHLYAMIQDIAHAKHSWMSDHSRLSMVNALTLHSG